MAAFFSVHVDRITDTGRLTKTLRVELLACMLCPSSIARPLTATASPFLTGVYLLSSTRTLVLTPLPAMHRGYQDTLLWDALRGRRGLAGRHRTISSERDLPLDLQLFLARRNLERAERTGSPSPTSRWWNNGQASGYPTFEFLAANPRSLARESREVPNPE